jgi:hypothetical protein
VRRAALLLAMLGAHAALGSGAVTLSIDGDAPSFRASPLEGRAVLPDAAHLILQSPGARWTLRVRALGPLTATSGKATLPIERVAIAPAGTSRWLPLALEDQTLLADQPPTLPEGGRLSFDYALTSKWGDPALPDGAHFTTRVAFTATSSGLDDAYAEPNPFVGGTAGTTFRFTLASQRAYSAEVVGAHGRVRLLRALDAAAVGPQALPWDGRDDHGSVVAPGAYSLEVRGSDGALLATTLLWVEAAATASASLTGSVTAHGNPVAGAQLTVRASDGSTRAVQTDAAGHYQLEGLAPGSYVLAVRKDRFAPFETAPFALGSRALVRYDVQLAQADALVLGIGAERSRVAVGALVPVNVAVQAVGGAQVDALHLLLELQGVKLVAGSLQADGVAALALNGDVPLGTLGPGQSRRLHFLVAVTSGSTHPEVSVRASASSAGQPVSAGPAKAELEVLQGELSGFGGIFGRVCFDLDGDGQCTRADAPARNAAVFLEEGSYAQADAHGRYHLSPVLPGRHVVLAGPGPLELGERPGAMPKLPRTGSQSAAVRVEPGGYVPADVALPVPPGFEPERDDAPQGSDDEGDVLPLPRSSGAGAPVEIEADEGAIDASGSLIGLTTRAHPSAAQLPAFPRGASPATAIQDSGKAPATPAPLATAPAEPSTALVGVGEGWAGLDLRGHPAGSTEGRLALTLQHDFAGEGRGTVVIDTGRDGRAQTLALLDPFGGQQEFGDDARVAMSGEERLSARLDLRHLYVAVGRTSADLGAGELIYSPLRLLGGEVGVAYGESHARAFAGFSADPQVVDELPGGDATGPYFLSRHPVLAGSEQVDVEIRGAGGEVRQRLQLSPFVDYFLDNELGRIDLSRPLPSRTPAGDRVVLVVRYQLLSTGSLLSGFVAGGRAQLGSGSRHLGLSGLYQDRPGTPLAAIAADGVVSAGPFELSGAVGAEPTLAGALHDRTAERVRLTANLGGVSLFGFGLANGAQWEPTIRSQTIATEALSPFDLLDAHGFNLLADPSLSLLLAKDRAFPFFLSEKPGVRQWGAGTVSDVGPVRGLALLTTTEEPGAPTRQTAAVGARAQLGDSVRVFAEETSDAQQGELLGVATAPRQRQALIGAEAGFGHLQTELEYRNLRREGAGPDAVVQEAAVKARYDALSWLQPAVALEQRWGADALTRAAALGLESRPTPWARLFAYVTAEWSADGHAQPGAFAGAQLGSGMRQLSFRYEVRHETARDVHAFSWQGRYELVRDLTFESDGNAAIGEPSRQLRFALAYVPTGALRILARATDEVLPGSGQETGTASLDVHLALSHRVALDSEALARAEQAAGFRSVATLGSIAVDTRLGDHFDVRAGARLVRDANGPAVGGFGELGYTLTSLVRLAAGVNLAREDKVFTIDRQAPGVFVHLTAGFGGAVGKTRPPPVIEETTVPAQTAAVVPLPAAPAAAPAPPRDVHGHVFVDLNHDGRWNDHEPAFEGVEVVAGALKTSTDRDGAFALSSVPGEVNQLALGSGLPFGYRVAQALVPAASSPVVLDVAVEPLSLPEGAQPFPLMLEGKAVLATRVDQLSMPLAAWVAGLPLSADEANGLEKLGQGALGGPEFKLLVVAHAQTLGAVDAAMRRAIKGGRYLKRYLQAVQMVPARRIEVTVLPPSGAQADALGHVELWLVKTQAAK